MTYIVNEIQKHRDTEMGNSVWAGVTWSRCGAVVAPSLTEYTIIHQSPLITDRFIPKHCIIDESVLCIQVYYALARPVVGNREVQSIITQLGELYLQLWRQNLLILEKFFNPNWRREKIPVILERNCWFCWNLWTFEIARDRIEEPESACVGIWDRITFPSTEEKTSMILRSSEGAKLQQYWYDYIKIWAMCACCAFNFFFLRQVSSWPCLAEKVCDTLPIGHLLLLHWW